MQSSRLNNVDVIRVIAMLLVIVLHTVFNFTLRTDFFGTKLWWVFEPLVAIAKTSTLLFFMLSGYLVINKPRTIQENWRKVKQVIIIPFLFFSCVDIAYQFFTAIRTNIGLLHFWQNQISKFVTFPNTSLWFLVVLFFLYLLNPVWNRLFTNKTSVNTARYVTGLAFLYFIIQTLLKFPSFSIDPAASILTGWLGFVCFYLYGGLVRQQWIAFKRLPINAGFILIGFVGTIASDYYKVAWISSLPIALMALGLFNVLIANEWRQLHPVVPWLAKLSFGIYLIHTFVVAFLPIIGFTFDHQHLNVYVFNLLYYLIVLTISTALTYIITKIPKVRAIIGQV